MWHYLYHNMFEPTSRWEQAKFDTVTTVLFFALIATACILVSVFSGSGNGGRKR